jgi:hypothetical protein
MIGPMKRVVLAVALLLIGVSGSLFAQYGVVLHAAAIEDPLSIGSAIRLLGVASGSLGPDGDVTQARATLAKLGVKVPANPDVSPISWSEFAYLIAQLFDLPASVAYGLLPGPWSAFDELRSRGLTPRDARPGDTVNGKDGLLVLRRLVHLKDHTS